MPSINRWGKHHIMTFTQRFRGRYIRIKARTTWRRNGGWFALWEVQAFGCSLGTRPPWTCSDAGTAILGAKGAAENACRKVAPPSFELSPPESPVLNMDGFLTAQLSNGEYCSSRLLETSRTLDGLEQQVQSLQYEHALSVRKQEDGRATLEAAEARNAEADASKTASLDASVAEATQAVFEAEQEILGLETYILDAEKEAEKVAELLANLRRSCRDDGDVTKHLEKLRWIIQVLPPCPGRNDFQLKIPKVAGLEDAGSPRIEDDGSLNPSSSLLSTGSRSSTPEASGGLVTK